MQLFSSMMRSLMLRVAVLSLLVCASPVQNRAKTPSSIDEGPLAKFIEGQLAERHIPGMAAAVVVDGDVVWAKGFGYADLGTKQPVTPDTLFVMAVSKTMVAAALMHAGGTPALARCGHRYDSSVPVAQSPFSRCSDHGAPSRHAQFGNCRQR